MAIKKEIVKDSGVKVNYHKIKSIAINERTQECIVTLEEYTDESFREQAKKLQEIQNSVDELYHKAHHEKNEKLAEALVEKANLMISQNETKFKEQYYVSERKITFRYIPKETTVEGFYKEIMKLDEFKDSEMI